MTAERPGASRPMRESVMGGKGQKKVLPAMHVSHCELIGFNWSTGMTITCSGQLGPSFCVELSNKLSSGAAVIAKSFTPYWRNYSHIVCWPGVGVFAAAVQMNGGDK